MTLKEVILEYSRKRIKNFCVKCLFVVYLKAGLFIDTSTYSTCKHTERIKSDSKTSYVGIVGSCFYALILLTDAMYQLSTYNGRLAFWDLKNMKALTEFCLDIAQSLAIVFLTKKYRSLKSFRNRCKLVYAK